MERDDGTLRFRLLGDNCVDCGFSLEGLLNTKGARICEKIERALIEERIAIDIAGDQISFIAEGVALIFFGKRERLSVIKRMLDSGRAQREPVGDSNYQGFMLTRSA